MRGVAPPLNGSMMDERQYVSRAGVKLAAALEAFSLDVTGLVCADLGCNVGGFTDVLLQRGAAKVYAVDTGYGTLAWKLRNDPRVVVMERTNALHVEPPEAAGFVVIDLGWTKQAKALPAAMRWGPRRIITLIKPHYEAGDAAMSEADAEATTQRVLEAMPVLGFEVLGAIKSPITGSKGGNIEYLALLEPTA
ncbi:MAG: hypothetical protein GC162_20020 [Planctomycetes bacterium]|nr:hypothetical protein [Planctomycetota bacterium]